MTLSLEILSHRQDGDSSSGCDDQHLLLSVLLLVVSYCLPPPVSCFPAKRIMLKKKKNENKNQDSWVRFEWKAKKNRLTEGQSSIQFSLQEAVFSFCFFSHFSLLLKLGFASCFGGISTFFDPWSTDSRTYCSVLSFRCLTLFMSYIVLYTALAVSLFSSFCLSSQEERKGL